MFSFAEIAVYKKAIGRMTQCLWVSITCILMLLSLHSFADDTELYFNPDAGDTPSILFLIDNSASMASTLRTDSLIPYNHLKAYPQITRNNTTFKPTKLYFTADNESYIELDARINTCAALELETGTLVDSFATLRASNEDAGASYEGWRPLTKYGEYFEQVNNTNAEPECAWERTADYNARTPAQDMYTVRVSGDVQKYRVWHRKGDTFYNKYKNGGSGLGKKGTAGWWTYEDGDLLFQQRDNDLVEKLVCTTPEPIPEVNASKGTWRALDCAADRDVHGQSDGRPDKFLRSAGGDDLTEEVTDASQDESLNSWWMSAESDPKVTYTSGSLSYGNYWNYWYGEGDEGQTVEISRWEGLVEAYKSVIRTQTKKKIGLMLFGSNKTTVIKSGQRYSYASGGFMRYPISDIDEGNHRNNLLNILDDADFVWGTPLGEQLGEAARYFRGDNAYYGNHSSVLTKSHSDTLNGSTYISPIRSSCQKNHIILMTDGEASFDFQHSGTQTYMRAEAQTNANQYSCSGKTCLNTVAQFLNQEDATYSSNGAVDEFKGIQNVTVHTVAYAFNNDEDEDGSSGGGTNTFLSNAAASGGGRAYSADNVSQLTNAFNDIILAINETPGSPAAPSVPVSASSRFSSGNQVYVSRFKPANTKGWQGNLKSYKLKEQVIPYKTEGSDSFDATKTVVVMVDQNEAAVLEPETQTTKDEAVSLWTNLDEPDGDIVTKGGIRDQLKASTQNVRLRINSDLEIDELDDFEQISNESMGVKTDAEKNKILKWALNYPETAKDGSNERSHFVADPLHSEPKVLAYNAGTVTNPVRKEVLFFGTNAGFLHLIDINSGQELSRWIPEELLSNLSVYFNDAPIKGSKLYGLDGDITLQHVDTNNNKMVDSGETAMLFIGMRRGGRNYYAIDISDFNNPSEKWTITGGAGDFEDLAYTWSKMVLRTMRFKGVIKDVLIFSGGYDPSHDTQEPGTFNYQDQMGRGVYIVDAKNGSKLWSAGKTGFAHDSGLGYLRASNPATPAALDPTGDGLVDIIYNLDLEGQLVRYSFNNNPQVNNSEAEFDDFIQPGDLVARLREFGSGSTESSIHRREFFSEPVVAIVNNGTAYSMSISFGSGRRVDPRNTVIQNRFYTIRQSSVFEAVPDSSFFTHEHLAKVSLGLASSGENSSVQSNTISEDDEFLLTANGFYVDLASVNDSIKAGEKVLGKATIISGVAAFATYIPEKASTQQAICEALGLGSNKLYALDIVTGKTVQEFNLLQQGIYGDVSIVRFQGNIHINAPVLDADGQITTLLGTDASGDPSNCKGKVCLPPSFSAFYKFWIERAL